MSEYYVCPKCNGTKFIGYDDSSGAECKDCGHFIPDNELDNYAFATIKKSELARRDEIIARLKEDADALYYSILHQEFGETKYQSRAVDAHRALMKELEEEK